jgi:hypothetical protein
MSQQTLMCWNTLMGQVIVTAMMTRSLHTIFCELS